MTNELDELKALRADTPKMTAATHGDIRARLLALANEPDGRREPSVPDGRSEPSVPDGRREPGVPDGQSEPSVPDGRSEPGRPGWRGEPSRGHRGRSAPSWRRTLLPVAAAVVLTLGIGIGAAVVRDGSDGGEVRSSAYRLPKPHQWIYTHRINAGGWDMNHWWTGVDPKTTQSVENWDRVDGRAHAFLNRKGALTLLPPPSGTGATRVPLDAETYDLAEYQKLPTRPEALLRRLTDERPPAGAILTPDHRYTDLTDMLQKPISPRLRTAAYQALFDVPGVTVRPNLADQVGRRGTGFSWETGGDRITYIFDPVTHEFLGGGEDATRAFSRGKDHVKKGTLLMWYAMVANKVVDKPGQR